MTRRKRQGDIILSESKDTTTEVEERVRARRRRSTRAEPPATTQVLQAPGVHYSWPGIFHLVTLFPFVSSLLVLLLVAAPLVGASQLLSWWLVRVRGGSTSLPYYAILTMFSSTDSCLKLIRRR